MDTLLSLNSNLLRTSGDIDTLPSEMQETNTCIKVSEMMSYDPNDVLGRGSLGTVVYRGAFGGREVAVKRVQIEFAIQREVELLIESDNHPHVVRYFCMEVDTQFRYLALELCKASLYDYVENEAIRNSIDISPKEILRQSTVGLADLHSIQIVHRDLKPKNVLISTNIIGRSVVKIADLGISKKIRPGRFELTRTREMAGTDGWMAPEELRSESTTDSMDIFSLGCIFYYVLTGGSHPYGEYIHRNSNVIRGDHSLEEIGSDEHCLPRDLISKAISPDPNDRPSAKAMLIHPFFWDNRRQLEFLGYVSNHFEVEEWASIAVIRLDANGSDVFKNNWMKRIDEVIKKDLLKIRTYKENSVRDLLRAVRNLQSHYMRRPIEVRNILGDMPDGFIKYFTSRFPKFLLHVYSAMESYAAEPLFIPYYSDESRYRLSRDYELSDSGTEGASSNTEVSDSSSGTTTVSPLLNQSAELEVIPEEIPCSTSSTDTLPTEDRPFDEAIEVIEVTRVVSANENWIGKLNQFCELNKLALPTYEYETIGDAATRVFVSHVTAGSFKESGTGKNKKEAKLDAAIKLYEHIRTHRSWIGKVKQFCENNALPDPEFAFEESGTPKTFTSHGTVGIVKEIGSGKKKQEAKADAARRLYQTIPTHGIWVGKLGEYCVKNNLPEPKYSRATEETGDDKMKTFLTFASVGSIEGIGRGKNKKESKADVARKLLDIVHKQVVALGKASHQLEGKTVEEPLEGVLAEPGVNASRAYTVKNPQNVIKTILSDPRFLSTSIEYRDVEEPNTRGRTQAILTIQFTTVLLLDGTVSTSMREREYNHVFSGEGMDEMSARNEAARAALVHILTYTNE